MSGFRVGVVSGVLMLVAALAGPVQAEDAVTIDMTKITCKQAGEMGAEFATGLIFWIDGYISKEKNDPTMSESWMNELTTMVKEGCDQTPNKPILAIVRQRMK